MNIPQLNSENNEFTQFLARFGIFPDVFTELQADSNSFLYNQMVNRIKNLNDKFRFSRYIYFFIRFRLINEQLNTRESKKTSKKPILYYIDAIYIGKSSKPGYKRVLDHIKMLKSVENKKDISEIADNRFYSEFYNRFFPSEINTDSSMSDNRINLAGSLIKKNNMAPIYLSIINLKKKLEIKNFLNYNFKVQLGNAESLLIGLFSAVFADQMLNHEFVSKVKWFNTDRWSNLKKSNKSKIIKINAKEPNVAWTKWCEHWFLTKGNDIYDYISILEERNTSNGKNNNVNAKFPLEHIELFKIKNPDSGSLDVEIKEGKRYNILSKSDEMRKNIITCAKKAYEIYQKYLIPQKVGDTPTIVNVSDKEENYFFDGMIYMVYILKSEVLKTENNYFTRNGIDLKPLPEYIPIYIGKTEVLGRNGGFSGNLIVAFSKDEARFGRWGTDQARHIGGLSSAFFNFPNKYPSTDYHHWIDIIFDEEARGNGIARLKFPVYFKMRPNYPYNTSFSGLEGVFTPEMEAILVSIAFEIFGNILTNKYN